jgi:MoaA/NifB/PqqE/SkfB family radical SAM enzyme
MRNYRGYEYNSGYPVTELSLAQFQHILPPGILQQLKPPPAPQDGFQHRVFEFMGVQFNGNLGDFALAHDAVPIVHYLVSHGVNVKINTNGSLRNAAWWQQLAHPLVSVGWALDGLEDTHHLYRQDTDWQRIIDHAQAYIAAGGRATWRFIPFDHNRHQEQACRDLAAKLGFEHFENIYDGRDRGPVFDRNGKFSHWIGQRRPSESTEPAELEPLLQNHITWFDHRTVQCEKDKPNLEIVCEHKRQREIYISADGSVYPCCFLGFYPDTMNHPGNQQLEAMVHQNNALVWDLEHCMSWFEQVEQSWSKPTIAQGRLYQCVNTCGRTPTKQSQPQENTP